MPIQKERLKLVVDTGLTLREALRELVIELKNIAIYGDEQKIQFSLLQRLNEFREPDSTILDIENARLAWQWKSNEYRKQRNALVRALKKDTEVNLNYSERDMLNEAYSKEKKDD